MTQLFIDVEVSTRELKSRLLLGLLSLNTFKRVSIGPLPSYSVLVRKKPCVVLTKGTSNYYSFGPVLRNLGIVNILLDEEVLIPHKLALELRLSKLQCASASIVASHSQIITEWISALGPSAQKDFPLIVQCAQPRLVIGNFLKSNRKTLSKNPHILICGSFTTLFKGDTYLLECADLSEREAIQEIFAKEQKLLNKLLAFLQRISLFPGRIIYRPHNLEHSTVYQLLKEKCPNLSLDNPSNDIYDSLLDAALLISADSSTSLIADSMAIPRLTYASPEAGEKKYSVDLDLGAIPSDFILSIDDLSSVLAQVFDFTSLSASLKLDNDIGAWNNIFSEAVRIANNQYKVNYSGLRCALAFLRLEIFKLLKKASERLRLALMGRQARKVYLNGLATRSCYRMTGIEVLELLNTFHSILLSQGLVDFQFSQVSHALSNNTITLFLNE